MPIVTSSRQTIRILMPGAVIFGGSRPAPATKKSDEKNTHDFGEARSFGAVYVNDFGLQAMKAEPPIEFPKGSIIVREKLTAAGDEQPQHLMVMIKRARGFNRAANDWEFLAINGAVTKIELRQKKGGCLDCHVSQKDRDFVYREPPQ